MKTSHKVINCKSENCRKCNRKHHTLLHIEEITNDRTQSTTTTASSTYVKNINSKTCLHNVITNQVLLATAIIKTRDNYGNSYSVGALLDSGSQTSFITQKLANKLKLPQRQVNINVTGAGGSLETINRNHNYFNKFIRKRISNKNRLFSNSIVGS